MTEEDMILESLSARRAWIEIFYYCDHDTDWMSLSARRAWIEIATSLLVYLALIRSLSARRAWIEICYMIHPV